MASSRTAPVLMLAALVIALAGCSLTPYRYEPIDQVPFIDRSVEKEYGDIRVRASVPSVEEAKRLFGVPLEQRGIQPVWLEISNRSDVRARVIHSSVDREYFSPLEVAYMHKKYFSKQGWMNMEAYLHENALPRMIPPDSAVSGFIFTHLTQGTKAFSVDVFLVDDREDYANFTFFIEVPGFVPDYRQIDFQNLYPDGKVQDLNSGGFRNWIKSDLPCCTTDRSGGGAGQALEIILVARGEDLLQALLRGGWKETSYERNELYLNGADYFFGRPPDAIFRKGRDLRSERNELALWRAPVRAEGVPVWIAQLKHPIGRRFEIGEYFFTVRLDPDLSEGRNYLLQDLWYGQSLEAYGWSSSGKAVSEEQPERDFRGNEWFADGHRLVLWISGPPIAMAESKSVEWDRVMGRRGDRK